MIGDIFVEKFEKLNFITKEEKKSGILYIYDEKNKIQDMKDIGVDRIVYLSYSPKNKILLGAGYGNGEVFSIDIVENSFGDDVKILKERSYNKNSMTHSIVLDRFENYAYSANLGLDEVWIYKIGNKGLKNTGKYVLQEGIGPRHMTFNNKCGIMYIVCENSNEVIAFKQDPNTGDIEMTDRESSLPEGFMGKSFGGTLTISNDNDYLLATNRGADTVAVFNIREAGKIVKIADLDLGLFNFHLQKENVYGI